MKKAFHTLAVSFKIFSFGSAADEVPCGCHKIFHKVDRAVAHITTHKIQHFVWKNIVCRF